MKTLHRRAPVTSGDTPRCSGSRNGAEPFSEHDWRRRRERRRRRKHPQPARPATHRRRPYRRRDADSYSARLRPRGSRRPGPHRIVRRPPRLPNDSRPPMIAGARPPTRRTPSQARAGIATTKHSPFCARTSHTRRWSLPSYQRHRGPIASDRAIRLPTFSPEIDEPPFDPVRHHRPHRPRTKCRRHQTRKSASVRTKTARSARCAAAGRSSLFGISSTYCSCKRRESAPDR